MVYTIVKYDGPSKRKILTYLQQLVFFSGDLEAE